jgi:hypothetical protein
MSCLKRARRPGFFRTAFLVFPLFQPLLLNVGRAAEPNSIEHRIDGMIRAFRRRLGIVQPVEIAIVPVDVHLASVERKPGTTGVFLISFEAAFLRTLDDCELRAAVAHELGHVWIFTHFPFLQTEALANRQALKLVSSEDLGRVYEKVRRWNATAKPLRTSDQISDSRRMELPALEP